MKLLIIEDDVAMCRVIRSVVAGLAAEIRECSNGMDALAVYGSYGPDFVLMDADIRDFDGIAMTQRIKVFHAAARIIVLTTYDDAALRDALRSAGASGCVLKEDLFDLIGLLGAS